MGNLSTPFQITNDLHLENYATYIPIKVFRDICIGIQILF